MEHSCSKSDTIWLKTPIQPHETNHTFNGIMGDLQSHTSFPTLEILGFQVGGCLGPTKVFYCEGSWNSNSNLKKDRTGPAENSWKEIFFDDIQGSRDLNLCTIIYLSTPIVLHPLETKGFYIHCQTHHDESLAYHSHFSVQLSDQRLCEDKLLCITTGLAKVGPTPFGPSPFGRNGWRERRAFCGSVLYRPKKWFGLLKPMINSQKIFKMLYLFYLLNGKL